MPAPKFGAVKFPATQKQLDELCEEFAAEVYAKGEEVDPSGEHDWLSLTVGWALAKGVDVDKAQEFATYIYDAACV